MSCRVNVVQGLFAAERLAEVLRPQPGELLVHRDVLSCGPLRPFRSLEQWAIQREAYWDSISPPQRASLDDLGRDLLANLPRLRDADSIVLWIGIGVAEQLLLAWVMPSR